MIPQSMFHGHRHLKMSDNRQWLCLARSTSLPDQHDQCGITPQPQRNATLDLEQGRELDRNPIHSAEHHCQLGVLHRRGDPETWFRFYLQKDSLGSRSVTKEEHILDFWAPMISIFAITGPYGYRRWSY